MSPIPHLILHVFTPASYFSSDRPSDSAAGWPGGCLAARKGGIPLGAGPPHLIYPRILLPASYYHFRRSSDFLASRQAGSPHLIPPASYSPHLIFASGLQGVHWFAIGIECQNRKTVPTARRTPDWPPAGLTGQEGGGGAAPFRGIPDSGPRK